MNGQHKNNGRLTYLYIKVRDQNNEK